MKITMQGVTQIPLLILLTLMSHFTFAAVAGEIVYYSNRVDLANNGTMQRWVKEFEAIYPQARVNIQGIPDYEKFMPKKIELREYGDVLLVPRDMPKQIFSKYFVPLNDMNLANEVYFPTVWEFEGNQYAYTQGVIAEGLVYNKKVFNDVGIKGPPTTFSALMAAAEKIKAAGKVPLSLNVGAAWPLQQWDKSVMAIANDGNYFSKMITDPQPFDRGKPYYESLKIASKIFSAGFSEPDFIQNNWESSKQDFIQNKIAMFYLGNWVIPQLIAGGVPSDEIGFVPFPFDDSGKPKGVLNFDWGVAVSRYSKNQETAKAWIRFMITKSNYADVTGFIPTDKSRTPSLPQLTEYMSYKPTMIQAAPESNDFIRVANKAGMDFMSGNYIRNILLSPDFEGSMVYWNKRWRQAKENF